MILLPLISIIIPVRNAEKFIDDCLRSVIKQTYSHLEIIIVNDDSSDKSQEIIDKYKRSDKRIKSYHVKKHNAAFTRREGLRRSSAEYVCFVDSDDVIVVDYVELLYDALVKTKLDISTAKIAAFTDDKNIILRKTNNPKIKIKEDLLEYFCDTYHWNKSGDYVPQSINAKLFKKDLLKNIDYSVIKTSILEDNYVIPQIFRRVKAQKIAVIDVVAYYYRLNEGSTMSGSLSGYIKYGDRKIGYPELFDITMNFIGSVYSDHKDIDKYIYKLKADEYYGLAQYILDTNVRISHMAEKQNHLQVANQELTERYNNIITSRAYRLARKASKVFRLVTFRNWFIKW